MVIAMELISFTAQIFVVTKMMVAIALMQNAAVAVAAILFVAMVFVKQVKTLLIVQQTVTMVVAVTVEQMKLKIAMGPESAGQLIG